MFQISDTKLDRDLLHDTLANHSAGAIVVFEGWVRNHNEGKKVSSLEYQVYHELALKEGQRILNEAKEKFNLHNVMATHREGHLALGEVAIWIGATASHRDDAFKACRYVIDEIKHRLPVWKKEHYVDQKAEWVFCKHHSHHVHFAEAEFYEKNLYSPLKDKSVLVVGVGGLGCPAAVALASAGVGKITLVDPDTISISNIHRQFLYSPNLVGEKKVVVARQRLMDLNPFIQVEAVDDYFQASLIHHDLVLDCTDNMQTKYQIQDACLKARVPVITAGIFRTEGQLRMVMPGQGCLRCLNETTPDDSFLGNCNDVGVLSAHVNMLGSLQASEAIDYLVNRKILSETFHFDFKTLTQFKVKNYLKSDCQYCAGDFDLVEPITDGLIVDIRHDVDLDQYKNTDQRVILVCERGVMSRKLAESLRAKGHMNFYSRSSSSVCPAHGCQKSD
jgi:adenylyltransferase/sulfurtransferase